MDESDGVRQIYGAAGGLALGLFTSIALISFGAMLVFYQPSYRIDLVYVVMGIGMAGLGLWMSVPVTRQLLRGNLPVVVMDEVGIGDIRTSRGFVRWSQVLDVTAVESKGVTYAVTLTLMDPSPTDAAPERMRLSERVAAMMGRPRRGGKLSISTLGLSVDGTRLYNMCLGYARSHKFETVSE